MEHAATGTLHHVELWVPDLGRAVASWGWLLGELGYEPYQQWPDGQSWRAGSTCIVVEQSPARTAFRHDRHRPGLNHLAFHVADSDRVEELVAGAPQHGWRLLFGDRHPYAGGSDHYGAYLENTDGYEAELVAPLPVSSSGPGVESPAGPVPESPAETVAESPAGPAAESWPFAPEASGPASWAAAPEPAAPPPFDVWARAEPTTTDSGRSVEDLPTGTTYSPGGQVKPPPASS